MAAQLKESTTHLFQPEFRGQLSPATLELLQGAVLDGVGTAFAVTAGVCVLGLGMAFLLPRDGGEGI